MIIGFQLLSRKPMSKGNKKGVNLSFIPLISCGGVWNTNDTNKWEKIHAIA